MCSWKIGNKNNLELSTCAVEGAVEARKLFLSTHFHQYFGRPGENWGPILNRAPAILWSALRVKSKHHGGGMDRIFLRFCLSSNELL